MKLTTYMMKSALKSFIFITAVLIFSLFSCKPVDQELKVKVETGAVTEAGIDYALIEGKVVDAGEGNIEQHGFCYGTAENPTIINNNTQLGTRKSAGDFSDSILHLQSETTYYARAYALASDEIYYGNQTEFTTLSPISPVVSIEFVGEVKQDTVEISSEVSDDGGSPVTSRGVCWSLEQNPSVEDACTTDGTGTGTFNSIITGLIPDTIYYIRAYATSSVATSYSDQHQVNTPQGVVGVTTSAISGITMNSAVSGGNVTDDGGSEITARGVCWSTQEHPSIEDSKSIDGTGSGSFTSSITGLSPGTTYYVRAYAINSTGPFYGEELSFTTPSQSGSLPVLTTAAISSITENSAVGGGNITDDGGSAVSSRGLCWSTSHNPDLSDGFSVNGSGTGSYTGAITGLGPNTTYYVRAYATNGEGTAYGSEETFTTKQVLYLPTLTTTIVASITEDAGVSGGNITDDGGAEVTARGVCWSTSADPDLTNQFSEDGTGIGIYTSSLSELSANTNYYVRAYASNSIGTAYGNQVTFTTNQALNLPTLMTSNISSITETSAVSGGNITDDGGSSIIARGVSWSTSTGPDLTGNHSTDGSGSGGYTSSLSGLSPNTTYFVRAYATNGDGTAFGNELSFTTNSSPALPTLTTAAINAIAANSAKSGGDITDDGGTTVIARGVCWSTSVGPDLQDSYTTDGGGIGSFTSTLIGLDPNTVYNVRAYATNGTGTSYGDEISFTTDALGETITDFEGNIYKTVEIGTQTWMSENLKATKFSNGDAIDQLSDVLDWVGATVPGYCYYDNDIGSYNETYGAIYNFYVIEDGRGVCPSGWHVPTEAEWEELIDFAGGMDVAGAKLKEEGTEHWSTSNYATDEFGFTALPGGSRIDHNGAFGSLGIWAYFWSSTVYSTNYAYYYGMGSGSYAVTKNYWYWTRGYSIRCIKD